MEPDEKLRQPSMEAPSSMEGLAHPFLIPGAAQHVGLAVEIHHVVKLLDVAGHRYVLAIVLFAVDPFIIATSRGRGSRG